MAIIKKYRYTALLFMAFCLLITSCVTTNKVKDGASAYKLKQYSIAVGMLKEEFQQVKRLEDKAYIAFILGDSYHNLLNHQSANEWYTKAVDFDYGIEALKAQAYSFKEINNYAAAINAFEKLGKINTLAVESSQQIAICKEAIASGAEDLSKKFRIYPFQESRNFSNYGSIFYEDDFIVFSSDRDESTGSDRYDWTGNKFSDLYIVGKIGGVPRKFDALINSDYNEGAPCFSKDYNEMFFTRCYSNELGKDDHCKLMYSYRDNGVWTEPTQLPFVKNEIDYGQPVLIENDSVIVFTSGSENGEDGLDLWYSDRFEGEWSQPFPMPSSINTQGDEVFPTADGDTLYFSSNFLPGYGGLDVFKTYLKDGVEWTRPEHLGLPINSSGDDFGYVIDRKALLRGNVKERGYISSTRQGNGTDDILVIETLTSRIGTPVEPEPITEEDPFVIYLAVKTYEKELFQSLEEAKISVKQPLGNTDLVLSLEDDSRMYKSDVNGLFIEEILSGKEYNIDASKEGFLNGSVKISTSNITKNEGQESYTLNAEIYLDRIVKDKEIRLENIYYEFNEYYIRDDAKPTLDILSQMLLENEGISIELGSHTDCRGEEDYNLDLSLKRAQAAIEYLSLKGVSKDRLSAKGYGETSRIVDCACDECTEDEYQMNRRTSFKIL